jgi:hypothetical protein
LEDGKESKAHAYETNDRSEPEDRTRRCPPEDEKASSEKYGANHHRWEAGFGDGFVAILFELADVEFIVAGIVSRAQGESI